MAIESSTAASSSRSGGGAPSVDSYIGSLISLTSKSEIRYEGILCNINTEESSIGLRNVRSFGTEGRKKDVAQVPPGDKIYEYILFRGTDLKDLQVIKQVQTTPAINSDPAIIQSHYSRPTTTPMGLATAPPPGSLPDLGSHSAAQMGLLGSNFQSGLALYQPGGNLNSWGPSPPNANGSGLPLPMYWQGFYGTPNGLPQLPQQSLLRPPTGLSMPPPPMQQMQFSAFNSSLPMAGSSLPSSSLPDYHSSLPASLASETMNNHLPNRAPPSSLPTSIPNASFPSLAPFSVPDNAVTSSVAGKTITAPDPATVPQGNVSQPTASVAGMSGPGPAQTPTPSLITPGQLLHSGPPTTSALQPLQTQTGQEDLEVVQVSPKSEPPTAVVTEAQPPILPLPPNARAHKPNGGAYHMRNNYRRRGGRGYGISRPVTKFTEEFDFTAMNEKFKKDEVWGHLGKSNRSQSKDKEGNGSGSDEEYPQDELGDELPKIEINPLYNKDDFFDSLSSHTLDNGPNHGRPRYSEQMKLDTETFGEFSRYRGGRGGRWPNRGGGGGRFRGSSYGRGSGGYNNGRGRGRGRGVQGRAS